MGVFSKLKNIFYDEEIVEEDRNEERKVKVRQSDEYDDAFTKELEIKPRIEEIKIVKQEPVIVKEESKVVFENPVKEENNERELFRSERKFNFTEFDDDDLTLPPRKSVLNTETRSNKPVEQKEVVPETPRVFKPSPIISPIYGILDKDYKKEEIVSRKDTQVKEIDSNARNYDTVRRKAYGTLEDELEDTLNSMNKITPEEIKKEEEKVVVEEKPNKLDEIINKMEKTSSVSVGDLEDKLEIEGFDDEEEEDNSDKTMTDSTLEHDLFNLIDSMYDDKEE